MTCYSIIAESLDRNRIDRTHFCSSLLPLLCLPPFHSYLQHDLPIYLHLGRLPQCRGPNITWLLLLLRASRFGFVSEDGRSFSLLRDGRWGGASVDRSICTLEGLFFPYMLLVRRTLSVLPLRTPPESVNNVQTKISGLRVYSGIEHVFHVRRIMGQFADRQSRGLRAQLVTKGGRDVIHGPASLAKISCMHAWPTTLFFFLPESLGCTDTV